MAKLVLLSFWLCAWAPAAFATPVSQVAAPKLNFVVNGHVVSIPYERNLALTGSYAQVDRATVLVHGTLRDAGQAYENLLDAASIAGVATSKVLLVAPQFLTEEDVAFHALPAEVAFWSESGWKEGSRSLSTSAQPRPERVSSFALMDSILYTIAARNPNLRTIVVAGHSAGGQFVNRYAAGNTIATMLQSRFGVTVQYVMANASSYLYLNAERVVPGTTNLFAVPSAGTRQACPDYNVYKYGLEQLNAYMASAPTGQLPAQYASRRVTCLLGQRDANPADASMDQSCAADLQGDHRLERGQIYRNHLVDVFGASVLANHHFEVIPGVGHSSYDMFTSDCGAKVLFGATTCGTLALDGVVGRELPPLSLSFPNPPRVPVSVEFQVPQEGARVTLRIHDAQGRTVRTLVDGARPAGVSTVVWDGYSDAGTRVAPGFYICRLQQGQSVLARKLAIVR